MVTDNNASQSAINKGPVLVTVDFAPDSEAAVAWAATQATCIKAPLLILQVVHDPAYAPGFYRQEGEDWSRPMEDIAVQMMEEFMTKMISAHSDLNLLAEAKIMLISGLPPSRILEVAEMERAQLIVVGSRGRTGLPHVLLGSVAERVAQTAPIPVVIIKSYEKEGEVE